MAWLPNLASWVSWLCITALSCVLFCVSSGVGDPRLPMQAQDSNPDAEAILSRVLDGRGLRAFQYTMGDLDGDGSAEIIAHVIKSPRGEDASELPEADYSALMVVSQGRMPQVRLEIPDGMLCPHCPIGTRDGGAVLPRQEMAVRDGRLHLCEAWGGAWYARECVRAVLDDAGVLRVENHEETAGWLDGPSEHRLRFDFLSQHGERSYTAVPIRSGFPLLKREVRFAWFVAEYVAAAPDLDEGLDEGLWATGSKRYFVEGLREVTAQEFVASEVGFSIQAMWRDDGLWLGVVVRDPDVVETSGCAEDLSAYAFDHMQLWLDLGAGMRRPGVDSAGDMYRAAYQEDPVRHSPDGNVHAFAVLPGQAEACVQRMLRLPDGEQTLPIMGKSRRTAQGYDVKMFIPAVFFGVDSLSGYEGRRMGVGFSVWVHNVSSGGDVLAHRGYGTSELLWGDPFTFGQLLMPSLPPGLPGYPLDWARWLD